MANELKQESMPFCPEIFNMTPEEAKKYDEKIERMEAEQAAQDRQKAYERTVPERYWHEALETYTTETDEQRKGLAAAKRFAEAVKRHAFATLCMIGKCGTGKTHLACGIIHEAGGIYRTASEIVEELRRAKSYDANQTEAQIIDYYSHVSLLVIDEIGRGINAQEEKYMLYVIINARYNTRKPTVLISNHTNVEFIEYMGTAATDRIAECGYTVEFTGSSYRKVKRESA